MCHMLLCAWDGCNGKSKVTLLEPLDHWNRFVQPVARQGIFCFSTHVWGVKDGSEDRQLEKPHE